jgi:hypothetical protein
MFTCILLNVSMALGQGPASPAQPATPNVSAWAPMSVPATPMTPSMPAPPSMPMALTLQGGAPPQKLTSAAFLQDNTVPPPKKEEKKNGEAPAKEEEKKEAKSKYPPFIDAHRPSDDAKGFFTGMLRAYYKQIFPEDKKDDEPEPEEPPRRAFPSPWSSPPFPGNEWQGYPLIGVPAPTDVYPFMAGVYNTPWGDAIKDTGIKFSGWVTAYGAAGNAKNSNGPTSYWVQPNTLGLDQIILKFERFADTVQTDHVDWGFRALALYGIDYRYTTAGGWGSEQLLEHNLKYGWDPTEVYFNVYVPGFLGGTDIRVGRWIACPDIETQYSVDNFMGSHSILFTYDTYTITGVMLTQKINDQWSVQGAVTAGTDMAPWYPGALWTGSFGFRWVGEDNNDAVYAWQNQLNSARFRHFWEDGQPAGHDNFNYFVATWEHRFNQYFFTKTEGYFMWQFNAEAGGTPSIGPLSPYGGGGNGTVLPGLSTTWGILNYTMLQLSDRDYITLRNEFWRDDRGMRSGFSGDYTSHTFGISHQFNDVMMVRPEVGYYRNWSQDAFDDGRLHGTWIYGFDFTLRF